MRQHKHQKAYAKYTIQYRDQDWKRRQVDHSDFKEALKHAIAAAINNGKREQVVLCGDDRHQYPATRNMLKP